MVAISPPRTNNPNLGIAFILAAMLAISVNDMLIKFLSGGYPLHQMVFIRSVIGITFSFGLLQFEGGLRALRTPYPAWHLLRGLLIVTANLSFFTALAVVPLANATALFFVAPLLITLLSIPLLGEQVGPWRLGAVAAGFAGVIVMIRPWNAHASEVPLWIQLMPILSAFCYALNQILTRQLGATSTASAMAIYIQGTFLVVSAIFFLAAGDGHFASDTENPALLFLLRAWIWPEGDDIWRFAILGASSAVIGYCISQAYRSADAATVAPFEYTGLPLAILWGWIIWGELPGLWVTMGILLIAGSGLFVFMRERHKKRTVASGKRIRQRF